MKYNTPNQRTWLTIDGSSRECVLYGHFTKVNPEIFPRPHHGRRMIDEIGIHRYTQDGQPATAAVRNCYLRLDEIDAALRDKPEGYTVPIDKVKGQGRRAAERVTRETISKQLEQISAQLSELVAIWKPQANEPKA